MTVEFFFLGTFVCCLGALTYLTWQVDQDDGRIIETYQQALENDAVSIAHLRRQLAALEREGGEQKRQEVRHR